jgi:RNA polymerase sigma-70 factor (ECF subfamily)
VADSVPIQELLRRVRAGDAQAAADFVRAYEPEIRRLARVNLRHSPLRQQLDSMDICNSVLGNFFVWAASVSIDLDEPGQLLKLLVTMTLNKLRDHHRKLQTLKRGENKRVQLPDAALAAQAGDQPTPSRIVVYKELLAALLDKLPPEERYLADQRAQGRPWDELAMEKGVRAEALRKRLVRALQRAAPDLGLEDF